MTARSSLLLAPLVLLAACAQQKAMSPAAPAPVMAPSSDAAADATAATPRDAEGEVAALRDAEAEIERTFASGAAPRDEAVRPQGAGEGAAQQKALEREEGGACHTACRALASMERSATHLCELTGDGDPRCGDARSRLSAASAKVKASCPMCQG